MRGLQTRLLRYREVFAHAGECLMLLATDGRVLETNPQVAQRLGRRTRPRRGDLIWNAACWAPPTEVERWQAAVSSAARGSPVHLETRVTTARTVRMLEWSLTPLGDERGGVGLILVEGRDLTAEKHIQEALHDSRELFGRLVAESGDALIVAANGGRIKLFNQRAAAMFGYTPDEIIGQQLSELIPDARSLWHRRASFGSGALTTGARFEHRHVVARRKSGEWFPADVTLTRLRGRPHSLVLSLHDLSDQWAGEEVRLSLLAAAHEPVTKDQSRARHLALLTEADTLLSRANDLDRMLEAIGNLIVPEVAAAYLIDLRRPGGQRIRFAARFAEPLPPALDNVLRNYPKDPNRPYMGRTAWTTGATEFVSRLSETRLHLLAQDEEHLEALHALGARSYVSVPLLARQRPLGVMTVIRDRSMPPFTPAEVALLEQLAQLAAPALDHGIAYERALTAIRQRDEVMSIVTHDLRGALNALTYSSTALEEVLPAEKDQRLPRLLTTMRESVEWMDRLINDLVDIASIEAGRLSLELRAVEPAALLLRSARQFEEEASARGVHLVVEVPGGLPSIVADPDRLLQVLANLISNALKFTPPFGTVTVSGERRDGGVVFTVSDSGPGIPEEEQQRIFDRFEHIRRGRDARGTGLGLAIARGIVESHGGRIWVESTVGSGSRFAFTIPLGASTSRWMGHDRDSDLVGSLSQ